MTENGRPAPALRYERWPLTDLQLDPRNARAHDRPNIDAIKESLERFGQRLPVVVRGGQLIGGNATTIAADELGWTHLDVAVSDDLTVEEARRLAIMLNRSAELAAWDRPILLEGLQSFESLEGTGFSAEQLADLEALTVVPSLDNLANRYGEPTAEDFWPVIRVKVHPDQYMRWQHLVSEHNDDEQAAMDVLLGQYEVT